MSQLGEAVMPAWKDWEGQTINAFRVGQYLGGSAQSAVFLTQFGDQNPQTAAIKFISGATPNAESRLAVWQFASRLSHPNLIRIYQTGHCQFNGSKYVYAVMEYAEENLSQIIPQRALTEAEAGEILPSSIGALAYLHANGLAHGPIKPVDIMAIGDQLKLSTDGLRRAGEPISFPTEYDPPEVTSAPAGDVWALGFALVEVCTQHLPAWDRSKDSDPDVPNSMPPALRDIARHCLRRDPRRRWTMRDLAGHLNFPASPVAPAAVATAQQFPQASLEQPIPPAASRRSARYLIAAVILFLGTIAFVGSKMLRESGKGSIETAPPAAASAPAKAVPEAPPPEPVPAPAKKSPPSPKQNPVAVAQPSATAPPVAAPPAQTAPPAATESEPTTSASAGVAVHKVLPDVSPKARNTIRGTVRVGIKVSLDSHGNVTDAAIDSRGPSSFFADLALKAARDWKFPTSGDATGARVIRFEFSRDGTKAFVEP